LIAFELTQSIYECKECLIVSEQDWKISDDTRVEVENALKSKSDKIGNLDFVDGFNEYYGYGKINAKRLLN